MSERKINLEYFIDEKVKESNPYSWYDFGEYYKDHNSKELKEFFKNSLRDFGKQLLELAAENAETKWNCNHPSGAYCDCEREIDKESILNTINLVE